MNNKDAGYGTGSFYALYAEIDSSWKVFAACWYGGRKVLDSGSRMAAGMTGAIAASRKPASFYRIREKESHARRSH